MAHERIYEIYKIMFPYYSDLTELYFPNGKNSIRVRLKNKMELIFTYDGKKKDFCFETVDHYLERRKS